MKTSSIIDIIYICVLNRHLKSVERVKKNEILLDIQLKLRNYINKMIFYGFVRIVLLLCESIIISKYLSIHIFLYITRTTALDRACKGYYLKEV